MTITGSRVAVLLASAAMLLLACGKSEEKKQTPAADTQTVATPAPPPEAPPEGITARARLDAVLVEAAKWQPDAQLFNVFTSFAEHPEAAFWLYDLQSPSKKSCMRLRAFASGRLDTAEETHECRLRKPVAKDFIDSPAAFKSAVAAGMKPSDNMEFSLYQLSDKALTAPRACWVVWASGDSAEGDLKRGWCVDPQSGTFVARLSGYGAPEFE